MLKTSRTWPEHCQNSFLTMAVVQLKFDKKGQYSYSTIANINQSQLIENNISIANGHSDHNDNIRESFCPTNGDNKKDLVTRKNVKSGSLTNGKGKQNGVIVHNGNSLGCTSLGKNGKVCLCELEFRDNKRKRSESIKVENWDYIYKENPLKAKLDPPDDERVTPK